MAHELTHHFLMTKGIGISDVDENERLTDLATVYTGLGILTLKGYKELMWTIRRGSKEFVYTYRVGYLSNWEIAMAINRVCNFRKIFLDKVPENLSFEANELLRDTRRYIRKQEIKIQKEIFLKEKAQKRKARKENLSRYLKSLLPFNKSKKNILSIQDSQQTQQKKILMSTRGRCNCAILH